MAFDGATQDRSVGSPGSRQHGVLVVVTEVWSTQGLSPFLASIVVRPKLQAHTVPNNRRLITYGGRREERRTDDETGRRPDFTTGGVRMEVVEEATSVVAASSIEEDPQSKNRIKRCRHPPAMSKLPNRC